MTAEEESGFTVIDKRRVSSDSQDSQGSQSSDAGAQATSAPSEEAAGTAMATEEAAAWNDEDTPPSTTDADEDEHALGAMPRLSVRDRLLMCIDILNQGAWISLGLVSDPATGQVERDIVRAKTAIDSVAFLAEKVEGDLDEQTRRDLKNLVRDLQLNYVQQMSR
jgi:hypothetical protein